MVALAAKRGLDYARADPRDRAWNIRHALLLRHEQRDLLADVRRESLRASVAVLGRDDIEPSAARRLVESINDQLQAYEQLRLPWADRAKERGRSIKGMMERWKAEFGDPDDPAVAARIEAQVRWLKDNDTSAGRG